MSHLPVSLDGIRDSFNEIRSVNRSFLQSNFMPQVEEQLESFLLWLYLSGQMTCMVKCQNGVLKVLLVKYDTI